MSLWLIPAAALVSFALTWMFRRYALARDLVDIPNARSSHHIPTVRGGGVAIALAFLLTVPVLWRLDWVSTNLAIALVGAGGGVAGLGLVEDHFHLPVFWRLPFHVVAAMWALYWLNVPAALNIAAFGPESAWIGATAGAVYIVWLLNLYNFMDGIDGIACIEAMTTCAGAALISAIVVPGSHEWVVPTLLLASVGGFFWWNYPPARIFMGDSGSGFLGAALAICSISAGHVANNLFWAWLVLLGVFIVDATATLLRRAIRGARIFEAHRSHAYQFASRRFGHKAVSLFVGAINLLWLFPIALLVGLGSIPPGLALLIAYGPLLILTVRFRAGAAELQQ